MKKNTNCSWQSMISVAILCALYLRMPLWADFSSAEKANLEIRVREAELARFEAEKSLEEVRIAYADSQRQVQELSRRFADLYLKSRSLQEDVYLIQQQAAGMLIDTEDHSSERRLARLMDIVNELKSGEESLLREVLALRLFLDSMLDALQASEAFRHELNERLARLENTVKHMALLPSLVAGRGGNMASQMRPRVLAVYPEIQMIIFDAGIIHGFAEDMLVYVENDPGKKIADFKIVETRNLLSAAILNSGKIIDIGPGAVIVKE